MGQHATIHGKTSTSANGASGTWQPVSVNAAGQLNIAPISGEFTQFNRLGSGPIVKYATVSAADTVISATPAILYGVVLIAAGTMASIYDNASAASGTVLIPSTTATITFNGMGVLCNNGIYADWTSGTWLVLYVDAM